MIRRPINIVGPNHARHVFLIGERESEREREREGERDVGIYSLSISCL